MRRKHELILSKQILEVFTDDAVISRTAHDGNAKYVATRGKHQLKKFGRTGIVTVYEMLRILRRH